MIQKKGKGKRVVIKTGKTCVQLVTKSPGTSPKPQTTKAQPRSEARP